jgi:O-methyltransferase
MECIKILWEKISKGGIVLLDDYGFIGHEEQRNAWDDFANSKGLSILSMAHGQGLLVKV